MADVKWIKITTDIFDNRKIRQIESLPDGDAIIVLWIKMLCLAGSVNDRGAIYLTPEVPYTDQMLATYFNRPLATIQLALRVFEQFGMIEIIDKVISISNWQKYQNFEKLDEIKEQNRLRQARRRAKLQLQEHNDMSRDSNVTVTLPVTQCNATEEDKDKEEDEEDISPPIIPPKVDVFCEFAKDNTDLLNALKDFEQMRKKSKSPMTDRAKELLCRKLEKDYQPSEWVAVLEQSTLKGWKDIYPLKNEQRAVKEKPSNGIHVQRDYDAILAAAEERAAQIGKRK